VEQEFQIGDKAVVPNQGVGVITDVKVLNIGGVQSLTYVVKMLDNGSAFHFPVGTAGKNNVRSIMAATVVPQVHEVLSDRDKPADKQTWNRRYREYTKKITTNDPIEVAAVLRDLAVLRLGKALSFGERKMYDRAYQLLVQELAAVQDVDEEVVKGEIESLLKAADEAAQQRGQAQPVGKKKKKA
jgi:CarD family transcriptional regulator